MSREYFYLDGKDQKGPFTLEQLRLNPQVKETTLVWAEGMDNWKEVKDLDELKGAFKKLVPPPPPTSISNIRSLPILEDSNVKGWVTFKICMGILIVFVCIWLGGVKFVKAKRARLEADFNSKVENVFSGKSGVIDGEKTGVEGDLKETDFDPAKVRGLITQFQNWVYKDKLYTVFFLSSGGFTIKKLTKQSEGFDLETYSSSEMGYRNSSNHYVEPKYTMGFKIFGGYTEKSYRPSVQECYSKAFDVLTIEDESGYYHPGKLLEITNFPNISNEYFYLENAVPRNHENAELYSAEWSEKGHEANVYNEFWRVYYKIHGKHFEIFENESQITKDFREAIGIPSGVFFFILVVLILRDPMYFRNLLLFGKRWKDNNSEKLLFFDHSFFQTNTFKEIIHEGVNNGILKFMDRGGTLNLSYPTKEMFFKIEKIDRDNLELISLQDGSKLSFIRVGASVI